MDVDNRPLARGEWNLPAGELISKLPVTRLDWQVDSGKPFFL